MAQAARTRPDTYTVKAGDTLFSIARQLYGDEAMWAEIYRLNTGTISDPRLIHPGQVLKLVAGPTSRAVAAERAPATEASVDTARGRKPLELTKPTPTPDRPLVATEPADSQDPEPRDSLFVRRRGMDAAAALRTYREQPYRPLRRGEFYAAGFLTEGDELPYGRLLGKVTPEQIRNLTDRSLASLHAQVAVAPPAGAQYQVNDSLLVLQTFNGPEGYGDVVVPTGIVRITGQNGDQAVGTVISLFGAVRNGHLVLPLERFVEGGTTRAQPVTSGVSGHVLAQKETRELKHPQNYLFISVGKKDGVARGDLFEVRRDPALRPSGASTIDEPMALLQVVHVRERSATVKVLNVISPDIAPGTRVKQVAKLPS